MKKMIVSKLFLEKNVVHGTQMATQDGTQIWTQSGQVSGQQIKIIKKWVKPAL